MSNEEITYEQVLEYCKKRNLDLIDHAFLIRLYNNRKAIPIEWIKNKRYELEKEYYDLFHTYTDDGKTKQLLVLNDFHAFSTVLEYWEKENEHNN